MRLSATFAILFLPGLAYCGFAGGGFVPSAPPAAAGTTFAPVNEQVFRLRQSDGAELFFVRDEEVPDCLLGAKPWQAELDGVRALVMTDPESEGDQTGFMFFSGRLRKMLVDGKEHDIPLPSERADVAALWPAEGGRLRSNEAPDIWKDGKRVRLWFDNPNKAGLLFAEICLLSLALVFVRRNVCRILGAALFVTAFAGLVSTSSRGAVVALLCGLVALAVARFRVLFNRKTLSAVATAVVLAAGCVICLGQGDRLVKNLFVEGQRGEMSRLTVWRAVPRMMVDAPGGWGIGGSARAYADWYQERSDCLLKNLISGHLTFLVETGWPVRFAYVLLWTAVLLASFLLAFRGYSPVPFALLSAFAAAACFNPVLSVPELVTVPLLGALVTAAGSRRLSRKARLSVLLVSAVAALAVNGGAYAAGSSGSDAVPVRGAADRVIVNGADPSVWIAHDDYVLHGGYWWMFGKEVRRYFKSHADSPAVAFCRGLDGVPARVGTLVLVGETAADYLASRKRPAADRLVLISPPFGWERVPVDFVKAGVRMAVGSLACGEADAAPDWVTVVPGAELYLPDWLDFSLTKSKQKE